MVGQVTTPTASRESDLYPPIKQHLQALGYTVRAEVGACDAVGTNGATLIAVELKRSFGLSVLYQAIQRMPAVDLVYVAVAVPDGRRARANWDAQVPRAVRLCRMLGIGLLSVRDGGVIAHADPAAYHPRKNPKSRVRLLGEFSRRSGDHNVGGTSKRPRMTAYREDALACAAMLASSGQMKGAEVRRAAKVAKASDIMHANVYGWFQKIARGTYRLTPTGETALQHYATVVSQRVAAG